MRQSEKSEKLGNLGFSDTLDDGPDFASAAAGKADLLPWVQVAKTLSGRGMIVGDEQDPITIYLPSSEKLKSPLK